MGLFDFLFRGKKRKLLEAFEPNKAYALGCDVAAQVGADAIKLETLEEDFGAEVKAAAKVERVLRGTRKPARKKSKTAGPALKRSRKSPKAKKKVRK